MTSSLLGRKRNIAELNIVDFSKNSPQGNVHQRMHVYLCERSAPSSAYDCQSEPIRFPTHSTLLFHSHLMLKSYFRLVKSIYVSNIVKFSLLQRVLYMFRNNCPNDKLKFKKLLFKKLLQMFTPIRNFKAIQPVLFQ